MVDQSTEKEAEMKQVLLAATYGSACPLRMQLDTQILSRFLCVHHLITFVIAIYCLLFWTFSSQLSSIAMLFQH